MHKSGRAQRIEALIKEGDYEGAQNQIDAVLSTTPGDAEAMALQREILWQMRQADEKNPILIQGTLAQVAVFAAGFGLCTYPFASICTILYNLLILHHYEDVKTGGGRFGLEPVVHVSPISAIIGSAMALCLGAWIMRVAYNSWRNS